MDKQWHVMALVLDLVPFRVIGIALANMSSEDFIGAALSPAGTPLSGLPAGFLHFFRKEFTEKQVYKDMETIKICEPRDAERLFESGELNDFILYYENQYPTDKGLGLKEIADRYTRSLTIVRAIKESQRQNQTFMISDSIRWYRNGDTREIYQKVGEKWIDIATTSIDKADEVIFKGLAVEPLCTEKELREALRNGKLRKFLTKVYLRIKPTSEDRIYTIGDNFITTSNEPFYSSANIAAKSKAQSKAREIEAYYDNAFSLQ